MMDETGWLWLILGLAGFATVLTLIAIGIRREVRSWARTRK